MTKRGRPSREPTKDEREKVEQLAGNSAPVADIARALKRSIPNLRKYFRKELISGKKSAAPKTALPFKVTKVHREKVVRYIGARMSPQDVAYVLDCTVEQLEEHFAEEIKRGGAKYRAKVIDNLDAQMEEGLVGATNRLEAMTAIPEGAAAPGAHLGKKAAADAVARAAAGGGNRFAPPAAPKLIVNNDK